MNEDAGYRLLVTAVTDLLSGQEQQSQKTAHLAEGLKQLAEGVQQLAGSVSTLHDDSRQQEERLTQVLAGLEDLKRKAS